MTYLSRLIVRVFWLVSRALSRGHTVRVWPGGKFSNPIDVDDVEYAMTTHRKEAV